MTLGYALLDDHPLDSPAPFRQHAQHKSFMKKFSDTTECNYLVMFFVVGVLGLALRDMTMK